MAGGGRDRVAAVVGRDRAIVWAGVLGLAALAWGYLIHLHRGMGAAPGGGMGTMSGMGPVLAPWTGTDALVTLAMWVVMMVAMMLPSAAPVILLFATVNRRRCEQGGVAVPTAVFVLAYLLMWGAFSVAATGAQWGLQTVALLSPAMATTSPVLGGVLLIAAGVYQLTPLKAVCLARCRSPLGFLMTEWREGVKGALRMGVRHGTYCLGCCWVLMTLLFAAGVMNLLWVAAITAFVLLEKVAPGGVWIGRVASAAMILGGLTVLAGLGA